MLDLTSIQVATNDILPVKTNDFVGGGDVSAIHRRNIALFPGEKMLPLGLLNPRETADFSSATVTAQSADDTEPSNAQPSGAYNIGFDTLYSDTITGKGKRRWYYFQLTEHKKITLYMSPVNDASVDNDLVLYSLDTTTGTLTEIARSQNGAAKYELLSYVGEAGYYFFCVAAYAGEYANAFSFLARLSDTWDSLEADDSLSQAPVQPLNEVTKHTIDNSIDQDLSILQIADAGSYVFSLFGVADNLNYQLQIFDANMNLLATVAANATLAKTLDATAYVLKLLAVDGTYDATNTVSVLVTSVPSAVNVNSNEYYWSTFTEDNKHFLEFMSIVGFSHSPTIIGISVDGVAVNVRSTDLKITRTNSSTNGSECTITTSKDTAIIGFATGKYTGSRQKGAINLTNTLLLTLSPAVYGESHYQVTTTQRKTWSNVNNVVASVIFDIDTMQVVDLFIPNWYFGDVSICGYPMYGSPESAYFTLTSHAGQVTTR